MSKQKLIPAMRFPEFENEGEWEEKKLGELGEFLGGGTPSRLNSEYWIGNIPWISSSDINEDDIHSISISQYINEIAIIESATKIIPKGSILFVSRVGVGKLAINNTELCTSQDFTSFISTNVLNLFIAYYYSANKDALKSLSQGTSIKGFSKSDLEDSKIVYPNNPKEQQKIASCLSSLDEVIAAHSQKLEVLKDHKKGLMQNLFPQEGETVPKYRFKEFEKYGEWEEKVLSEVALYENGKAHEQDISENGNFVVVNSKFISTDGKVAKYSNSAYCLAEKGDILMVLSDIPNGRAIAKCFYIIEENKYTVNQRICKISSFDCDSLFLYYTMNRNPFFLAFDDGVKQTNLRNDDVQSFPFLIPIDRKEQQKIASCLSFLDAHITAVAEKIEQLKLHKKGLMQGLFPKIND
ncbi:restriction endonuclease subunit S [Runella sp.]|uniref:restriction endonuclease subunit S n=1 Tax=Runella sp. TaxID=1960881 RepID=UPI0030198FD8